MEFYIKYSYQKNTNVIHRVSKCDCEPVALQQFVSITRDKLSLVGETQKQQFRKLILMHPTDFCNVSNQLR